MKIKDLTGQRFGRLVALRVVGRDNHRHTLWLCQCDCGNTHVVESPALITGRSRSCGCLLKEVIVSIHITHGGAYHPLYGTWLNMKQRCGNPNHKDYSNYGGRGISMCPRWKNDFGAFLQDVGERPDGAYSIDRINNDGNYEPGNVRWATPDEQAQNKPSCILLSLNGVTKPLTVWAKEIGISASTLRPRHKRGWSDEMVLTTPVRKPSERKRDAKGMWLME